MKAHFQLYEQILMGGPEPPCVPAGPECWVGTQEVEECCSGWLWALQERDREEGESDGAPQAGAVARHGVTRYGVTEWLHA